MERIPIYILNLEKQKYKYDKLDGILKGMGIEHQQRFEGVEGRTLSQKEINKISSNWVRKFGKKSVIGCALSYLNLWKHIVDNEDENGYVLTMEDSFIPDGEFVERINVLLDFVLKNKEKIDYINLHHNKNIKIKYNDLIIINDDIKLLKYCHYGVKCCLIKVKCLKKLIMEIKKINEPIDDNICTVAKDKGMQIYLIKDNVFGTADFSTSTITGQSPYLLHKICNEIKTSESNNLSRDILYSAFQVNGYGISEKFITLALMIGFVSSLFVKLEYFICFLLFMFLFDFLYFKINKKNIFNSLMNVMFVFIGYYLGEKMRKIVYVLYNKK